MNYLFGCQRWSFDKCNLPLLLPVDLRACILKSSAVNNVIGSWNLILCISSLKMIAAPILYSHFEASVKTGMCFSRFDETIVWTK